MNKTSVERLQSSESQQSNDSQPNTKKKIISLANAIKKTSLEHAKVYPRYKIYVDRFGEWPSALERENDPDKARTLLYYGFQPLYDALTDKAFSDSVRPLAVEAMDNVLKGTQEFLAGYYVGKPDLAILKNLAESVSEPFKKMTGASYFMKSRNIDNGDGYQEAKNVKEFLVQSLEYIGNLPRKMTPRALIGCACGSSELVLPLASMLNVPYGFIRMSKRRGDESPVILDENRGHISSIVSGKPVICVEDCVNSCKSLGTVMFKTRELGASQVVGMTAYYNDRGSWFNQIKRETVSPDLTCFRISENE